MKHVSICVRVLYRLACIFTHYYLLVNLGTHRRMGGNAPKIARMVQPIAQFLAAFPANLLFPVVVMAIVQFHLNIEIWTTPLMILGTQWYVYLMLSPELVHCLKIYITRRVILACVVYCVATFGVTRYFSLLHHWRLKCGGGAWNASIVAEVVSWGNTTLRATGLGEYIAQYTAAGDYPRIALGIGVMCIW